jgi:hypothetical protein
MIVLEANYRLLMKMEEGKSKAAERGPHQRTALLWMPSRIMLIPSDL